MSRNPADDDGRRLHAGIRFSTSSRLKGAALAIGVLALGGVFAVLGLVLLVVLIAAGVLFGGGVLLYSKLTGRLPGMPKRDVGRGPAVDPMMEVFPEDRAERRLPDEARRTDR